MFGDVFLLERDGSAAVRAERLAFGETPGATKRGFATRCSRTLIYFRCAISPLVRTPDSTVTELRRKRDPWTSLSSISSDA